MANGAVEGGAAAAMAAEIAQAIKASGAIVRVEPTDFMMILDRVQNPLVVCSESRFLSRKYHYLTAYKGLVFYTKSTTPLMPRPSIELIQAKKIWIPD
jgi:hypothetical protein